MVNLKVDDNVRDGYVVMRFVNIGQLEQYIKVDQINNVSYTDVIEVYVNSDNYHLVKDFYARHNKIHGL